MVYETFRALLDTVERIREGDPLVLQEGIACLSHACRTDLWPVLAKAGLFKLDAATHWRARAVG